MIVLENGAHPHVRRELIFRQPDFFAFKVRRSPDAVGPDIDRVVAERARHERRHADIGGFSLRDLDREARQRQFADVELGLTERSEENFLRTERHEYRVYAIDLHEAVGQRPDAVVIADGDGQIELGHELPLPGEEPPLTGKELLLVGEPA